MLVYCDLGVIALFDFNFFGCRRYPSSADMYCVQRPNQAEDLQQPYDNNNDDYDIQDAFDLSIHGDIVIDEPKQHTNDD